MDFNDKVEITAECRVCGDTNTFYVSERGYVAWKLKGQFIQDALPNLTAGQRELLISGCCEPCFDRMFKE